MIFIAGHKGMVGSSIFRELNRLGKKNIITKTSSKLDLTNQSLVEKFFKEKKVTQVYLAAAKVGGIYANNEFPAEFIYKNLMIQSNVINSAFQNGVKKLLFLGSSCIYPAYAKQPMKENQLLTGILEKTNEPYAISKIAGIKLCESYNRQYSETFKIDFRSVMPTNLYGPGDNYHSNNSHVVPALIRRFHEAKVSNKTEVKIWGSGNPRREFLHVDDLAKACIHIMELKEETYSQSTKPMMSHINVGSGEDISIRELAELVKKIIGFNGNIVYDKSKPDGPPRKLMDSTLINSLGWTPKINLKTGLELAYKSYLNESYKGKKQA